MCLIKFSAVGLDHLLQLYLRFLLWRDRIRHDDYRYVSTGLSYPKHRPYKS